MQCPLLGKKSGNLAKPPKKRQCNAKVNIWKENCQQRMKPVSRKPTHTSNYSYDTMAADSASASAAAAVHDSAAVPTGPVHSAPYAAAAAAVFLWRHYCCRRET
jgi:hypothetical protein